MKRLAILGFLALACFCGEAPPRPAAEDSQSALFDEVSRQVGLEFEHFIGATGDYFLPEIMGSGVALLDYDLDGDLDVYLAQGSVLDPAKSAADSRFSPPETHWPGGRLYRNELVPGGELRFADVTDSSGIEALEYGMGVAVGDYDNDGDPDLYLTNVGPNRLWRNDGDGTFSDATAPGLDDDRWSTSAAFVDYDSDGDLDIFYVNYVDFRVSNNKQCFDAAGSRDYCTPNVYNPVPDRLLRNDGGRFTDVSVAAGLGKAYGNGLGVACADFNGDGWIDLYVANDGVANQLWLNNGEGGFNDDALMAGAAYNADGMPEAGMGVSAGDFDADGDEDLFMTHLAQETNTLYVNNGSAQFRDETNRFGLGGASAPFTGFGARWFDFNHDGKLDLFVANGAVTIVESQRGDPYPFRQSNQLYRASGLRFEEATDQAGPAFLTEEVSRGAAFGDVDNDGDVDVVVSNNNGPARLLLNAHDKDSDWVRVRLVGTGDNRDALGARAALILSDGTRQWRRVHTDGSYLSASEKTLHFGIPEDAEIEGLDVVWTNGDQERFNVNPGQATELIQGSSN